MTMSVVTSVKTVGSKKAAALRGALAAGDDPGAFVGRACVDVENCLGQFPNLARGLIAAIAAAPLSVERAADDCAGISGYRAEFVTGIHYAH
jgi:hypothetical protein